MPKFSFCSGEGEKVRDRRLDVEDASVDIQHHEPDFEPGQPVIVPASVALRDVSKLAAAAAAAVAARRRVHVDNSERRRVRVFDRQGRAERECDDGDVGDDDIDDLRIASTLQVTKKIYFKLHLF